MTIERNPSVPPETPAETTIPLFLPLPPEHHCETPGTDLVPDPAPIEGELVTAEENAELDRRMGIRHAVGRVIPRVPSPPARVRFGAKAAARQGFYLAAGVQHVAARWADSHGTARFERQMRAAEAAGDTERLAEWRDAAERAKQDRHERAQARRADPFRPVKRIAGVGAAVLLLLVMAGGLMAVAYSDITAFLQPFQFLLTVVRVAVTVVAAALLPAMLTAPVVAMGGLWAIGRRHAATPPSWAQSPATAAEDRQAYAVVNEDMLTRALGHCKVTKLNQAIKAGEQLFFDVLPRQQGGGTYVQIRMPFGVLAADFLHPDTIERLAGNLGRHKHEVYPQRQPAADARVLDLWVADQGTMDRPAPGWPLAHDGAFDVFNDRMPWGVTMRGEQVEQGMLARHVLVGAVSKQGKTATMRVPALGLALDPSVELRIADLKGDGDWSMFAPRAHTLIEGGADEQAEATCSMLENLVDEMQDRYERKRAAGIRGPITRDLSRKPGSGFHPIYAIVDECQVLYQAPHPVGTTKADARAWRAAKRLHDQARAVNIHLWQATQRPDPTAIPAPVREGAHVRISLYVANYEAAKMVLADAADMGARPQDLRPHRDRGTFVATGEFDGIPEGMAFLIVKSHFIDTADAYPIIERAMALREQAGIEANADQAPALEPGSERDPLADIAAVLGHEERMTTTQVLAELIAADEYYQDWSHADLTAALGETAKPYKSDGKMTVSAKRVQDAITERDELAVADTDPEQM